MVAQHYLQPTKEVMGLLVLALAELPLKMLLSQMAEHIQAALAVIEEL
jgi:hypothetical protein